MNLQQELAAMSQQFAETAPERAKQAFGNLVSGLKKSGIIARGPKPGDRLSDFSLQNIYSGTELGDKIQDFTLEDPWGEKITLSNLLQKGPVVLNFYRGNWCPFCNVELRALEKISPQIRELGANLVAISLEKPDESLKTIERHNMQFIVLSDINGLVAKQFKLLYRAEFADFMFEQSMNHSIAEHNGQDVARHVIPATYVIDTDMVVRFAFADEDFTQRTDPEEIIATLKDLKAEKSVAA